MSDLEILSLSRLCQLALQARLPLELWTQHQKLLLAQGASDFALFIRELKKLKPDEHERMVDGFSQGQVLSKLWLIDILRTILPPGCDPQQIHMGSWFGLLARLWFWKNPNSTTQIKACDLDPTWEPIAKKLNQPQSWSNQVQFQTRDLETWPWPNSLAERQSLLVINTSSEHLAAPKSWFQSLPFGLLVAIQGSDDPTPPDHLHPWRDLAHFVGDFPMTTVFFEGQLELPNQHRRFMKVGIR